MRILWSLFVCLPVAAWAVPLDLHYGVNEVDINADGVKDIIMKVRWENGNAHSFDKYMVAVRLEGGEYPEGIYEVPLGEEWDYRFVTNEGAECLRVGYRFELGRGGKLEVQKYSLEEGRNFYCEPTNLRVTKFLLEEGSEKATVPFYLKEMMELKTVRAYASVTALLE